MIPAAAILVLTIAIFLIYRHVILFHEQRETEVRARTMLDKESQARSHNELLAAIRTGNDMIATAITVNGETMATLDIRREKSAEDSARSLITALTEQNALLVAAIDRAVPEPIPTDLTELVESLRAIHATLSESRELTLAQTSLMDGRMTAYEGQLWDLAVRVHNGSGHKTLRMP